jgi:cell division protease FtsH
MPAAPVRVGITYTFFKQQVEADNVVKISAHADTIEGTFRQAVAYPPDAGDKAKPVTEFSTVLPAFADPGLESVLSTHGVAIGATSASSDGSPWLGLLLAFGPAILLFGGMYWLFRRAGTTAAGGPFGIGKSQARRSDPTDTGKSKVSFANVAGIDEAEDDLIEIVDFLKDPTKYTRLRWHGPARGAAGRTARDRQDAPGEGRGRRGRRAVLQHGRE